MKDLDKPFDEAKALDEAKAAEPFENKGSKPAPIDLPSLGQEPVSDKEIIITPVSVVKIITPDETVVPGKLSDTVGDFAGGTIDVRDQGSTPGVDQFNSGRSREQKLRAYYADQIDNVISERSEPEFVEEKDLTVDGVQGLRRRRDVNYLKRQRKISEVVDPANRDYHNSLDFVFKDKMIAASGGSHKDASFQDAYPHYYYAADGTKFTLDDGDNDFPDAEQVKRGAYRLKSITLRDGVDGLPVMTVQTEDLNAITLNCLDNETIDETNIMMKIRANENAEYVKVMQQKAGDEADDTGWNPLAKQVEEPKRINAYIQDIEISSGSLMALATRSLNRSHAIQFNLLMKEGKRRFASMRRMVTGSLIYDDSSYVPSLSNNGLNIAGFCAMNESIDKKFKSKGDFLTQRKAFGMYIERLNKHYGQFVIRPEFKKFLDSVSAVGFEDSKYNPLKPVFAHRKVHFIDGLDLSKVGTWAGGLSKPTYSYKALEMYSADIEFIGHDVLEGIYSWLTKHWTKFKGVFGVTDAADFVIPAEFDFINGSFLAYLIASSANEIAEHRENEKLNLLKYIGQHGYPYSGLVDLNVMSPLTHGYGEMSDYRRGLKISQLPPQILLDFLAPENLHYIGDDGAFNENLMIMPWYLNAETLSKSGTLWKNERSLNWPSYRKGIVSGTLSNLVGIGSESYRKTFDPMAVVPGYDIAGGLAESRIYEFTLGAARDEHMLVVQYATRLAIVDYLRTPRVLGFVFDAPSRPSSEDGTPIDGSAFLLGTGNYVAISYYGIDGALKPGEANAQLWRTLYSVSTLAQLKDFVAKTGIAISEVGYMNDGLDDIPVLTTGAKTYTIQSNRSLINTALTKIMFLTNPFNCVSDWDKVGDDFVPACHPLEIQSYFGLIGFRNSEFSEEFVDITSEMIDNSKYLRPSKYFDGNLNLK